MDNVAAASKLLERGALSDRLPYDAIAECRTVAMATGDLIKAPWQGVIGDL